MATTYLNEPNIVIDNTEFDTHSNTILAGANFAVLYFIDREYYVAPYTDKYELKKGI